MQSIRAGPLVAAVSLVATAALGAARPLGVSVNRARAMTAALLGAAERPRRVVVFHEVPVLRFNGDAALLYKAGIVIDADGSPRAYHPDAAKGLDRLDNACSTVRGSDCYARKGVWHGIVAGTDPSSPPTQNRRDPAPGFYISTTTLARPPLGRNGEDRDPLRYVDSEAVPYLALPKASWLGAKMGDFGVVLDTKTGALSGAIVADSGSHELGEISIRLAANLGLSRKERNPRKGGVAERRFAYVVLAGSGNNRDLEWPLREKQVLCAAKSAFDRWGGVRRLRDAFPQTKDLAVREPPCPELRRRSADTRPSRP